VAISYLLIIIGDLATDLIHDLLQAFPGASAVSRSVDGAALGKDKNDLVGGATPHHILDRTIQVVPVVVYLVCVRCLPQLRC
jgi:hypothetical protein